MSTNQLDDTRAPAHDAGKLHDVTAGRPVTYKTSGHPPRADSPTYRVSRVALKKIVTITKDWYFKGRDYQDHHGGGLWLHDGAGWFFVRNLVGIEWSAQFCADPKKVDALRANAQRLYARFPESFAAFKKLGIDLKRLLDTPMKNADGVAEWTDSICTLASPCPNPFTPAPSPKAAASTTIRRPSPTSIAFDMTISASGSATRRGILLRWFRSDGGGQGFRPCASCIRRRGAN
jgi:hypothetical protein